MPSKSSMELSPSNRSQRSQKTPKTPKTPKTERLESDSDSDLSAVEPPVTVEPYFDFYDPLSKEPQVLPLAKEVCHHRPGGGIKLKGALERRGPSSRAVGASQAHVPCLGARNEVPLRLPEAMTPKTRARNQVEAPFRLRFAIENAFEKAHVQC